MRNQPGKTGERERHLRGGTGRAGGKALQRERGWYVLSHQKETIMAGAQTTEKKRGQHGQFHMRLCRTTFHRPMCAHDLDR
jgi:hypothetical protein